MNALQTMVQSLKALWRLKNNPVAPTVHSEITLPSGEQVYVLLHDETVHAGSGITPNLPGCCYTLKTFNIPQNFIVGNTEFFKLPTEVQKAFIHHEAAHLSLFHHNLPAQTIMGRYRGEYKDLEYQADYLASKTSDMLGGLQYLLDHYPHGLARQELKDRIKTLGW